jgi:D-3-phosphoglycerate dehydrogenase
MYKVLLTNRLLPEGINSLYTHFELIQPQGELFSIEELLRLLPECDALLSTFSFTIDKKIIDAGSKLRIIANHGVGYNNIDVEYATQKGIVVTNTPDPVTEPTAEMAMALMYAVARRIAECDRKLRVPNGLEWGLMKNLGVSLYGKTLGIVGLGRIGKSIARRAVASGMNVIYHNRHRLPESEEKRLSVTFTDFDTLLQTADVISINTPLSEDTKHLISTEQFDLMKTGAIVINTARGPVVDEKALVEALQQRKIWGAGLDVYEFEPKILPELLELDNVVLAPHNGTATIDARIAIAADACRNIIHFFEGKEEISVVNPEVLSTKK